MGLPRRFPMNHKNFLKCKHDPKSNSRNSDIDLLDLVANRGINQPAARSGLVGLAADRRKRTGSQQHEQMA